jgi:chromosome segregation ATPase
MSKPTRIDLFNAVVGDRQYFDEYIEKKLLDKHRQKELIGDYYAKIKDNGDKIIALKEEIKGFNERKKILNDEIDELKNYLLGYKKELKKSDKSKSYQEEIESEIESLTTRINENKTDLIKLDEELYVIHNKIESLISENIKLEKKIDECTRKITEISDDIVRKEVEKEKLSIDKTPKLMHKEAPSVKTIQYYIGRVEAYIKEKNKRIEENETSIIKKTRYLNEKKQNYKEMLDSIKFKKKSIETNESIIKEKEKILGELEIKNKEYENITKAQKKIHELETKQAELQTKLQSSDKKIQDEIDNIQKQIIDLEDDMDDMVMKDVNIKEIKKIKREIYKLKAKNQKFSNELIYLENIKLHSTEKSIRLCSLEIWVLDEETKDLKKEVNEELKIINGLRNGDTPVLHRPVSVSGKTHLSASLTPVFYKRNYETDFPVDKIRNKKKGQVTLKPSKRFKKGGKSKKHRSRE